ncbi:MAG TPA: hypothetical protein VG389_19770 [Myxococcota bacterium]|jgi:hypothetical protein|nr:hypothetical protein [Myxococcota bacterium]
MRMLGALKPTCLGHCAPALADGMSCASGGPCDECASGYCDDLTGPGSFCAPPPPSRACDAP